MLPDRSTSTAMNHDHNLSIESDRTLGLKWSGTLTYLGSAPGGGTDSRITANPPAPPAAGYWPLARVYLVPGGAGPGVRECCGLYCGGLYCGGCCGPWCCGLSRRGGGAQVSIGHPRYLAEDTYTNEGHPRRRYVLVVRREGVVGG